MADCYFNAIRVSVYSFISSLLFVVVFVSGFATTSHQSIMHSIYSYNVYLYNVIYMYLLFCVDRVPERVILVAFIVFRHRLDLWWSVLLSVVFLYFLWYACNANIKLQITNSFMTLQYCRADSGQNIRTYPFEMAFRTNRIRPCHMNSVCITAKCTRNHTTDNTIDVAYRNSKTQWRATQRIFMDNNMLATSSENNTNTHRV